MKGINSTKNHLRFEVKYSIICELKSNGSPVAEGASLEDHTDMEIKRLLQFAKLESFSKTFEDHLKRVIKTQYNRFIKGRPIDQKTFKLKQAFAIQKLYPDPPPGVPEATEVFLKPSDVLEAINEVIIEPNQKNRKIYILGQAIQIIECLDLGNRIKINLFCPVQSVASLDAAIKKMQSGQVVATLKKVVNDQSVQCRFLCSINIPQMTSLSIVVTK